MAIKIIPKPTQVEWSANPPTATLKLMSHGDASALNVTAEVLANTAATFFTQWGLLYRQDVKLSQTAYNHFDIDVPYGTRQNESGQWTWDFDTTGGTVHITHAKQERGRFPADKAPDLKGVIGLDGDQVQGTEIVIPVMKMNVQFRHTQGEITIPKAKFLSSITGTVNLTPMLTFAPGEVLFLGARGSDGSDAEASVGYQFAMSSNATGLNIGGIADIVKRGHDHAWIRYEDAVEAADGVEHPVRTAQHVYVDRVYDEIDMATALGFGG